MTATSRWTLHYLDWRNSDLRMLCFHSLIFFRISHKILVNLSAYGQPILSQAVRGHLVKRQRQREYVKISFPWQKWERLDYG